ncbi:DUF6228 family protein [Agromyces sp. H3Y2-19a]|uniref:DUF6228 family protein n=1 Tax=Agromyces chromiiresistens TaxID=3030835 RepID=UPI0023BA20DA|nr:DUF6228 family protein [Agromyces chromiiresistens]MDF0512494.1 DUF6228 family protein [Agromyces chromiiresistens]
MEPIIVFGSESEGLSVVGVGGLRGSAPEQALVQVRADGLSATRWISEYPDFGGLVQYFAELERHWRGWQGTKSWISLEGDLALAATHTGSHVAISVSLETPWRWKAQVDFSVGAGEELSAARVAVASVFTP